MVSDDELERRIDAFEQGEQGDAELEERVEQLERDARDVHGELARRIEHAEEQAVTSVELESVIDRLDAVETRLDELESRV